MKFYSINFNLKKNSLNFRRMKYGSALFTFLQVSVLCINKKYVIEILNVEIYLYVKMNIITQFIN